MEKLNQIINKIKNIEIDPNGKIQERLDDLTKPRGSLGRLEELAKTFCSIRGKMENVKRKAVFVMAGDHGVANDGVSAFPQAVTYQMVLNFINGGAAINVLARNAGAEVIVTDCGVIGEFEINHESFKNKKVAHGTKSFLTGPAMSKEEAVQSIEAGIEVFEEVYTEDLNLVAPGDMGIGNTTPSSAITNVFTGVSVAEVVGRGTGVDDDGLKRKIEVIEQGIENNQPDPKDPIDVLSKVGGFEIGAIAGLCLAAASKRVPVLIDGFIVSAGALIASEICPNVKDYLIASHKSVEIGHQTILKKLGKEPLMDMDLRLGEGTGSALAFNMVEVSTKILLEMATFSGAKVETGQEIF